MTSGAKILMAKSSWSMVCLQPENVVRFEVSVAQLSTHRLSWLRSGIVVTHRVPTRKVILHTTLWGVAAILETDLGPMRFVPNELGTCVRETNAVSCGFHGDAHKTVAIAIHTTISMWYFSTSLSLSLSLSETTLWCISSKNVQFISISLLGSTATNHNNSLQVYMHVQIMVNSQV